jgi:hypothetical protein
MIDALFWYTGLIAWVFIAFAWMSNVYVGMHDKAAMRRARAGRGGPTAG